MISYTNNDGYKIYVLYNRTRRFSIWAQPEVTKRKHIVNLLILDKLVMNVLSISKRY